jgi:type II secretory pathway pseudopilin PulG
VELMIAIVVLSTMMLAVATFVYGVSDNWQQSDSAQSAFLAASGGVDRLNVMLRQAQQIDSNPINGTLDNSGSPAACMLWTDTNGDGLIQYSEMTLLKYDPASQMLAQYTIPATATNAATQAGSLLSSSSFAALPNVIETPLIHDITACQIFTLNPSSTTPRPSVEAILQMATANGSSKTLVYATATLRAPE